ncbi:hypothetical protein HK100_009409 [Physocladia obscura]|uniref:Ankyrin repeat protein n=1 Tax=Physocladia obscura TaxID=109957 RepID=A0AAD5T410_9FUNG|nr:hypothetical protein HK100_009409 [Physocladia obscura]
MQKAFSHFATHGGALCYILPRHLNKTPSESNESKSEESTTGSFARFIAARDANSNAPIHLAVTGNHLEAVAQLVQSGADVSSHDASGRTPIDLVRARTRILKTQLPTIMAFRNDNDRRAISGYSSSSNSDLKHRYLVQLNAMMVILEASIASDRIVSNTATVVKKDDELKKDYPDELISALEYKFKGIKVYQDSQIVNEISELLDSLKM